MRNFFNLPQAGFGAKGKPWSPRTGGRVGDDPYHGLHVNDPDGVYVQSLFKDEGSNPIPRAMDPWELGFERSC